MWMWDFQEVYKGPCRVEVCFFFLFIYTGQENLLLRCCCIAKGMLLEGFLEV